MLQRPLEDEWYRARSPDFSKITIPFPNAASLGGHGLHARGNSEAFTQAASTQKWLETHGGRYEELFYLERGRALQQRFLDYFLKGIETGWDKEAPVLLSIRRPFTTDVELRKEQSWPLPATKWTSTYLDASNLQLSWNPVPTSSTTSFKALEETLTFRTPPLNHEMELTGPLALMLYAYSTTTDIDLFLTLRPRGLLPRHRRPSPPPLTGLAARQPP